MVSSTVSKTTSKIITMLVVTTVTAGDYKEFLSEDIDNYALQIFYFFPQGTFYIFSAKYPFFGKSHFWGKLDDCFFLKNPYYEINILILYRVKNYKGTFTKYRN